MNKKILLIDDDRDMSDELTDILLDEGFLVIPAFDGINGEKLINDENFDIILLDLKLPGMNGIALLIKIKEKNRDSKVIVLTGKPLVSESSKENKTSSDKQTQILNLADWIINKPFDVESILSKIKDVSATDN